MKRQTQERTEAASRHGLSDKYIKVRQYSEDLIAGLTDADATVQSMADASPAKWHAAHVTWFFEELILKKTVAGYKEFDDQYSFLFNSYYEAVGDRQPRPKRGMLTRPSLEEVTRYREHVDAHMTRLLENELSADVFSLVELGLAHEEQHQELFLTDILHLFAQSPLKPVFKEPGPLVRETDRLLASGYCTYDGGLLAFGADGEDFAFDCEGPRHQALVEPFALAKAPVTARAWADFIEDGGYDTPLLWLSDGWAVACTHGWQSPLYWERRGNEWWQMTLRGMQPVDLEAPVAHISYYEADAFATWAGKRLASEYELELAARDQKIEGNFAANGRLRTAPVYERTDGGVAGLFGNVWEWTSSNFTPYRGFRPAEGVVSEYNGKFMSGQQVLRGGSCATPEGHIRPTYRNFWHPDRRWQFSGLRLAEDR